MVYVPNTKPIRLRVFIVFVLVCAGTILLSLLAENLFLERFYVRMRREALQDAYGMLEEASALEDFRSEAFGNRLQMLSERYNIQLIVLDENAASVRTTSSDPDFLGWRLWEKLLDSDLLSEKPGSRFQIEEDTDDRVGMSYLEAYGQLGNGNLFLMRTPLSGIRESVSVFNRFMLIVSVAAVLLGSVTAFLAAYRLTRPKTFQHMIEQLQLQNRDLSEDLKLREETDARRRAFLSAVSHELKTPIALIQGYAEGLRDHVAKEEADREAYAGVIIDEAGKMNRLVRELAMLYELEEGRGGQEERFDLTEVIQNFLKSADIITKQEDVSVRFADYPPVPVYADAFRTEEILQNYFNNALQHLGGERVVEIRLDAGARQDMVRVSVFNTGKPIEAKHIPHLFEPFYKADPARTREYGGSGLGLSIVRAIQEAADAAYGMTNYENGVSFYFDVRRAPDEAGQT